MSDKVVQLFGYNHQKELDKQRHKELLAKLENLSPEDKAELQKFIDHTDPEKPTVDFEAQAKQNAEKQAKLKKERAQNNRNVLKSYKIK